MALQSSHYENYFPPLFHKCSTSSHQVQWVLTLMLLSLLVFLFSCCYVESGKHFCVKHLGKKQKQTSDSTRKRDYFWKCICGMHVNLKSYQDQSFTRVRFFFLLPRAFLSLSPASFSFSSFLPTPLITDHRSHCPFNRKFQLFLISILSESWKTILSLISSPSPINVFDWLRKLSIVVETIMHSPS